MFKNINHENQSLPAFRNGITLQDYLSQMKTLSPVQENADKVEEDLYETCQRDTPVIDKLTFEIRESDQDDYEESTEEKVEKNKQNRVEKQFNLAEHKFSLKNILLDLPQIQGKASSLNGKAFHVKKQKKTPNTERNGQISLNKNFIQTSFLSDWTKIKNTKRSISPILTSNAKHMKSSNGRETKKQQQNKQKYFQTKSDNQMQFLIKYEKQVIQKQNRRVKPEVADIQSFRKTLRVRFSK